jgi:hypothetical protein
LKVERCRVKEGGSGRAASGCRKRSSANRRARRGARKEPQVMPLW